MSSCDHMSMTNLTLRSALLHLRYSMLLSTLEFGPGTIVTVKLQCGGLCNLHPRISLPFGLLPPRSLNHMNRVLASVKSHFILSAVEVKVDVLCSPLNRLRSFLLLRSLFFYRAVEPILTCWLRLSQILRHSRHVLEGSSVGLVLRFDHLHRFQTVSNDLDPLFLPSFQRSVGHFATLAANFTQIVQVVLLLEGVRHTRGFRGLNLHAPSLDRHSIRLLLLLTVLIETLFIGV